MYKRCLHSLWSQHRSLQRVTSPAVTSLLTSQRHESTSGGKIKVDLPDLNTSVNIHEHKLKRPDGPPRKPRKLTKWKELETLKEETKVDIWSISIFVSLIIYQSKAYFRHLREKTCIELVFSVFSLLSPTKKLCHRILVPYFTILRSLFIDEVFFHSRVPWSQRHWNRWRKTRTLRSQLSNWRNWVKQSWQEKRGRSDRELWITLVYQTFFASGNRSKRNMA